MSLPLSWVERIFAKLTLVYGQAFLLRWRDIEINDVKTDWGHELSGLEAAPYRIAFALSNLPDKPPTVFEFRALCRSAPVQSLPRLDAPPADPVRVAAELTKLRGLSPTAAPVGNARCGWAQAIVARVQSGDRTVTPTMVDMARSALGRYGAEG